MSAKTSILTQNRTPTVKNTKEVQKSSSYPVIDEKEESSREPDTTERGEGTKTVENPT
jgi:hypothetical protein